MHIINITELYNIVYIFIDGYNSNCWIYVIFVKSKFSQREKAIESLLCNLNEA